MQGGVVQNIVSQIGVGFESWLQHFLAVGLGKLFKLAVPQFPHQKRGINTLTLQDHCQDQIGLYTYNDWHINTLDCINIGTGILKNYIFHPLSLDWTVFGDWNIKIQKK